MKDASFKTYGFHYECDGKQYAFAVLAVSEENARKRVASMSEAALDGELRQDHSASAAISSSVHT